MMADSAPCAATTLAWFFGDCGDPAITCPVSQIVTWIGSWETVEEGTKTRINSAWRKVAHTKLSKWTLAKGPITATLRTLLDIGWSPVNPNRWMSETASPSSEEPLSPTLTSWRKFRLMPPNCDGERPRTTTIME